MKNKIEKFIPHNPSDYDTFYDTRFAELGECPYKVHVVPPDRIRARPPGSRKTLGQVAFEADRENVLRDPFWKNPMMSKMTYVQNHYIPTWEDLPGFQKQSWENFALRISIALVKEFPDELEQIRKHGDYLDVVSRPMTNLKRLHESSAQEPA